MRRPARVLAAALTTGLLVFGTTACGGSEEPTQSTAAADADGALVVYSGRDEELVGPLIKRYERSSGQKIEVRYGDSAELASTLVEEGDRSPADVFFPQDAGALGAVQEAGLFAELPKATLDKVPTAFRSQQGRWVGASGRARTIAYDTRKLEERDLAPSILDYTDPKWKGRIGWVPTNASFQAFVTSLRATRGEGVAKRWLEGIVANDPVAFEKNSAARDAVADGEVEVAFINSYYVAEARAEEGEDYPVGAFTPPNGDLGALVNVTGAGVLQSSKRPKRAAAFVDYLLSTQAQSYFAEETFEYPLIDGVQGPKGLTPLKDIQEPGVDLTKLADLPGTVRLLRETGAL